MKSIAMLALALATTTLSAQQSGVDRIPIPLTNPSRPVFLKVSVVNGGITVRGKTTNEVTVEAKLRQEDDETEETGKSPSNSSGLRLIPNTSTGLTVEEEDNEVSVSTGMVGVSRSVDLVIDVPLNTSVKLSTVNNGDIAVDHVNGDLEVSNVNGSVTLSQVSGSAVAHALNGELKATFTKVNPAKPMSFSSLNGTIDVTFPPDLKATLLLKSEQGEIYSDFDMQLEKTINRVEESRKENKGRYRVSVEKGMKGKINGGGSEIVFKNFNGEIYVRKGK